jgi:mRNA interferase MazF
LSKTQKLNKGEIWLANLNPSKGTEPGKTRPVLIVQNQALLDVEHPSTLIIPLTTSLVDNAQPLRIRVKAKGKLEQDSDLLIDQIRAIDNQRLVHGPLITLSDTRLDIVFEAICEVMGMGLILQ